MQMSIFKLRYQKFREEVSIFSYNKADYD
eukprot:UN09409